MQTQVYLSPSLVQEFVSITSQCDFDIDIEGSYNKYTVDAKSILGILGLDMSRPLIITYDGYNEKLENFLSFHKAAV